MTLGFARRFLGIAVFAAATLAAGGANAACFTVNVTSGSVSVSDNPLDNSDTVQTFQIDLHNNSCGTATAAIGVANTPVDSSGDTVGSPVQNGYSVEVSDASAMVDFNSPVATLATVSAGTVADGDSGDQTWTVTILAHSIVDYAKRDFTIYVVGEVGGVYDYVPVNAHVDVAAITELSFGGASTTLTMNFGELTSNAIQNVNVTAQATVPFDIVWTSENNGVLKNLADGNWTIPYTANLNGATMDNSTAYSDSTLGGTQGAAVDLPLTVTVGDVTDKRAGTYQDIVTIKIQPR